jgi:hypothetical protein
MWRSFASGTIALFVSIALPAIALADGTQEGSESSNRRDVRTASHVGELSNDKILWRSRYAVAPVALDQPSRVAFVRPLPDDTEFVETSPPGATLVRDGSGRPTALRIPGSSSEEEEVSMVVRHGFDPETALQPPFSGERTEQRVALEGLRYAPADESGLRTYPGHMAHGSDGQEVGDRVEGYLGDPPGEREHLIYVRPTDLASGGLSGEFTTEEAHRQRVVFLLGGALVLFGLLVAGAYKLLEGRAKEERAEAILEEHGAPSDDSWEDRL